VLVWLEREGLGELALLFKGLGLDGSVLFALFEVRKEASYISDCERLGITAVSTQLKLKGRLAVLFA
jgi:hypothetical protein